MRFKFQIIQNMLCNVSKFGFVWRASPDKPALVCLASVARQTKCCAWRVQFASRISPDKQELVCLARLARQTVSSSLVCLARPGLSGEPRQTNRILLFGLSGEFCQTNQGLFVLRASPVKPWRPLMNGTSGLSALVCQRDWKRLAKKTENGLLWLTCYNPLKRQIYLKQKMTGH